MNSAFTSDFLPTNRMKGTDMKTFNSFILLPFLIILLLVTTVNGSSDWVECERSNTGNVLFYNKVSIKHRTEDIVQVWYKLVYSDEGREECIQQLKNRGFLIKEEWDRLSYRLALKEIDCKKEMSRFLSVIFYDTDGSVLSRDSYDKPKWDYMVPGSMMDILRKKVCK
jgi:hypothetical protein